MIDSLQSFDRSLFLVLNSLHADWLNELMVVFSGQLIWMPFVFYFFWISFKKFGPQVTLIFALFLLLSIISSDVNSSYILKNIVSRLRPCKDFEINSIIYSFGQKCGGKYGFVSSHAANSMAFAYFSLRSLFPNNKWAYLFLAIPLVVGFSRIYLGVHYPGDILGGMIIGLLWSFIYSQMFRSYQGARRETSQEPFTLS